MMKTILLATGAALMLVGVASACGGDDGDSGKSDSTKASGSPAPSSPAAEGTRASQQSPTTAAIQNAKLSDLLKDSASKTFYVVYSFETTGSGAVKGTMTIAQKPPKSLNSFDIQGQGAFATINDGQQTYTCNRLGAQPSGVCQKTGAGPGAGLTFFNLAAFAAVASQVPDVKEIAGRTIAGHDARCFDYTASGSPSTVCVDKKDGMLLYVQTDTGGNKMTIGATEVKASVDDKVFDLPYKVQ